jgi:hypothetical protein
LEDLIDSLTRGNTAEVKVVLASVVAALAVYQLVLIAVGYGKLRPPFLGPRPASTAQRGFWRRDRRDDRARPLRPHLAQLGPTSVAELEARQEARDARIEADEERREAREERREEGSRR